MLQRISLGEVAVTPGINKCTVPENWIARAVLLDESPRMKRIAWDDAAGFKVEIPTQEDAVALRLTPRNVYYLLVARLNTDARGMIITDDFVMEYVEMAENTYKEFIATVEAFGNPGNSLILQKAARNRFSYMQIKPANIQLSETLLQKVNHLKSQANIIDGAWGWIDTNSAKSIPEYQAAKQQLAQQGPNGGGRDRGYQQQQYGGGGYQQNNYTPAYTPQPYAAAGGYQAPIPATQPAQPSAFSQPQAFAAPQPLQQPVQQPPVQNVIPPTTPTTAAPPQPFTQQSFTQPAAQQFTPAEVVDQSGGLDVGGDPDLANYNLPF
jgi:hypothetical protein